ncbi:MAG: Ada metal-binding domain-containing protein [Methanotrichaceae archaeon]
MRTKNISDCRLAKNIKTDNEIWFSSSEDARANGYVPCETCKPP